MPLSAFQVALFMAKRCLVEFNWLLCLHVLSFLLIGCRDNDYRCSSWARIGECQRNPRYMRLNCKRSCRLCGNYNSKWQWSLTFDQLACSSRDIRLSRSTIGEHFAQPLGYSVAHLLASLVKMCSKLPSRAARSHKAPSVRSAKKVRARLKLARHKTPSEEKISGRGQFL